MSFKMHLLTGRTVAVILLVLLLLGVLYSYIWRHYRDGIFGQEVRPADGR